MKSLFSKRNLAFLSILAAMLLSSLACQTILGSNETAPQITNTPVVVIPTETPVEEADPETQVPTAVPEIEPTETEITIDPTSTPEEITSVTPPADLDTLFEPFWEVWDILHEYYIDQPLDDQALFQGAISGIEAITITATTDPVLIYPDQDSIENFADQADTPNNLKEKSHAFWSVWITSPQPKDAELMRAALNGMVDSLGDRHTSYLDPDQNRAMNTPLEGEFEGIGAWVDPNAEYLTVVSPMPDSPAEKAGLKPGDEIIKVDGDDMTGIDGNLVIRRVIGPAGTEVTLTIRREGVADLFEVTITRARIIIPSIDARILEDSNIAYLQIFNFGQRTPDDIRLALRDMLSQNPKGLILDLRNNGGGLLDAAIEISSEFIEEGSPVVYQVYGDGSRETHEALKGGLALDIPMVVLVNEGSASASEILAGAIQDYDRGLLVGTTTFGKGSVQVYFQLSSDKGGAIRVTHAKWLTPAERQINEIGLEPDVFVEITEEDIAAELDPQLDKAVELLLEGN